MSLLTNLIGYWSLDEASGTRADSHGTNDLTDNNSVGSTTGKVGTAASFVRASSQYLSHADDADLSVGDIDFSTSCWVQLTSNPGPMSFVCKASVNDLEYDLGYSGDGTPRFRFRISSALGFGSLTIVPANNLGTPSFGTWYHLVAWHDSVNNQIGIAVNGGTADTASYSSGSYNSAASFLVGGYQAYGEYVNGLMDEVGFWKRVLTLTERSNLYNSGSGLSYAAFGGGPPPQVATPAILAMNP